MSTSIEHRRRLGNTELAVYPLCLGGNVFGWTADEEATFAILDGFVAAGGNLIDTADSYSAFAPGNHGGESETLIGQWMAERGNRDDVLIATKVGRNPGIEGLSAATIRRAAEASLERLKTDHIDLYYAHADDPHTPLAETLGAFAELVGDGRVRYIAASNYSSERLAEALAISDREGLPRYQVIQPHFNLMERGHYEGSLSQLCVREEISCLPYYGLAKGFLTGKYRPGGPTVDSPRATGAGAYLDGRGLRVLDALDAIAAAHDCAPATVALSWLLTRPQVAAPIASARVVDQLGDLLAVADVQLTEEEADRLTELTA